MLPGIWLPFAPTSGGAAPPPSSEWRTSAVDTTNQTTYTFNNVDIGTADSTRRVIVAVTTGNNSATTLSSATIAGISATIHVNISANDHVSLISAVVTSGTTATISVTFSAATLNAGIGVWKLINETSSTPFATATDTTLTSNALSVSINVPSNGSLIAASTSFGKIASTYTWTGATERYDQVIESQQTQSGASETGLGSQTGRTVTATMQTGVSSASLAVLTWG